MSKKEAFVRKRAVLAAKLARLSENKKARLEQRLDAAASQTIPRRAGRGSAPLSYAQQGLWLLDRLYPGNAAFNIPLAFRFEGPLSKPALRRALEEMVGRHEILRTTISQTSEGPVQKVGEPGGFSLPGIHRRGLTGPEREALVPVLCREEAERPFDLAREPMIRAMLLVLDDDDLVLMITQHHIISDGWSMNVFIREMGALYLRHRKLEEEGGPLEPLPAPSLQFSDFAEWQRRWCAGPDAVAHLAWWRSHLDGVPAFLDLPADKPRPAVRTFRGDGVDMVLDEELSAAALRLARQEDASLFMVLLAVLHLLLFRCTNQAVIVTGTQAANRERDEVSPLLGFLANTLAIRSDPDGAFTFREFLARVKKSTLNAFTHQELPFELLLEHLPPFRDLSRPPVFQVMCNLQNFPRATLPDHQVNLSLVPVPWYASRYDLSLVLTERGGSIFGSFQFNTGLFEKETVMGMADQFRRALALFCKNPLNRLDDSSLNPTLLPRPALAGGPHPTAGSTASDIPVMPLAKRLTPLFAQVLGKESVGIHDSFFERGGRSLQAAVLAYRVGVLLGRDIPVRSIYTSPTIARLAEFIHRNPN